MIASIFHTATGAINGVGVVAFVLLTAATITADLFEGRDR